MSDLTLRVEGMSCGHCKSAVEKAVGAIAGVTAVEVNLDAKQVLVSGNFAKTAVLEAIEDAGFDVVE